MSDTRRIQVGVVTVRTRFSLIFYSHAPLAFSFVYFIPWFAKAPEIVVSNIRSA